MPIDVDVERSFLGVAPDMSFLFIVDRCAALSVVFVGRFKGVSVIMER